MGIKPGRQLLAYVFVASRCGHCQRADTRTALRELPRKFKDAAAADFKAADVVVVALDANVDEGLAYLRTLGVHEFDEISIGRAWLNEHMTWWGWRSKVAEPAVPQVVLVSRDMAASYPPLSVRYTRDSVVAVLSGRNAVVEWVGGGADIADAVRISRESASARDRTRLDSTRSKAATSP